MTTEFNGLSRLVFSPLKINESTIGDLSICDNGQLEVEWIPTAVAGYWDAVIREYDEWQDWELVKDWQPDLVDPRGEIGPAAHVALPLAA